MLDAYTAGVNAFIRATSTLPIEYAILDTAPEPWENWHCRGLQSYQHVMHVRNGSGGACLALAIGPEKCRALWISRRPLTMPPGEAYQGPPLDGFDELYGLRRNSTGSGEVDGGNAWVISGESAGVGCRGGGDSHRALDVSTIKCT